jgi:hypothetical protein
LNRDGISIDLAGRPTLGQFLSDCSGRIGPCKRMDYQVLLVGQELDQEFWHLSREPCWVPLQVVTTALDVVRVRRRVVPKIEHIVETQIGELDQVRWDCTDQF